MSQTPVAPAPPALTTTRLPDVPVGAMSQVNHNFWYDAFEFEIYTRNPLNLEEGGWHIQVGTVHGETRQQAKQALANAYGPYFDEIITFSEVSPYVDGVHINDTKGALRSLMHEQVKHERATAENEARKQNQLVRQ